MERALIVRGVKGAIVIAVGLLVTQAMSRASAAARHLVLCFSIAAALAIPLFGALVPAVRVDLPLPALGGFAPAGATRAS